MDESSRSTQTSSSATALDTPRDSVSLPSTTPKSGNDNASPLLPKSPNTAEKSRLDKFQEIGAPWLLEWCALLFCIVSFGGLMAILARFDNKLLSEWAWKTASINTVISILATISKTTLALAVSTCVAQFKWNWFNKVEEPLIDFDRFDAASRGAWGSFRLIRTIMRRPHWIVLGALTTIIFPAYGPFLQALINLENEDFVRSENGTWSLFSAARQGDGYVDGSSSSGATIGRCSRLAVGSYGQDPQGQAVVPFPGPDGEELEFIQWAYEVGGVDFGMMAAVWNGLSDLVRPIDLWTKYACATGNCTWDAYTSLAVCSKCNDISRHLTRLDGQIIFENYTKTSKDPGPQLPEISYPGPNALNSSFTAHTVSGSGLNISNYNGPFETGYYKTLMTAKVINNPGLTMSFQHLQTMILAIQLIKANDNWRDNKTWWQNTTVTAQECSLSFCIAAYNSSVEQGDLNETIHATWNNRSLRSFESEFSNDEEYTKYQNYSLDLGNAKRSDIQLFIPADSKAALPKFRGNTFNITQSTIVGMIQVLLGGFGETYTSWQNNDRDIPWIIYPGVGGVNATPEFGRALGNSQNCTATFERLASSLTKWMRTGSSAEDLSGLVRQSMVVIKVSWQYLVVPSLTLVMGLAVVFLAIADTKRKGLPAWKAEILVPLGSGTEKSLHDKLESVTAGKELSKVARDVKVSIKDEGGVRKLGITKDNDEA